MRKYLLTFILLLAVAVVMGQKKSVIILKSSSRIQGIKINGVDLLKVYNGIFQQDYSTLRSDSAYFYQAQNMFDAFGHVNISQGDTLNIYSDKLNYNGNTKIAILTEHVSMVDKDATLTTNYLTYNTATRYGTYTNGGKLVNKENTLTSKNGYYFANTRDSYFRYDVHLLTPDALIVTDTLRYNSGSRIAYFYGPTNIYGKKTGKDNDTLYTENGTYNTQTEQAFFGKKNLYKQGTKSLKGDSLFYDRKVGYGRAVKNVVFNDTEQKMTLKGELGTYYRSDERTVMTENPYGIIVTDETDTTKRAPGSKGRNAIPIDSAAKKTLLTKPDTKAAKPELVNNPGVNTKKTVQTDTVKKIVTLPSVPKTQPARIDSSSIGKFPFLNKPKTKALPPPVKTSGKDDAKNKFPYVTQPKTIPEKTTQVNKPPVNDTSRIKHDTIYYTADTLQTQILTYKALKDLLEKQRLANIRDTSSKAKAPSIVYKKAPKYIEVQPPKWQPDTTIFHRNYFGPPKPVYVAPKKPVAVNKGTGKATGKQDTTIKKSLKTDSVYLTRKIELSDTSRIRILSAFHNAKIFKSDLQAKSDSIFYSNSDSTIRMFVRPMIWSEGSQLSGDTIYLQMKNKKIDNMEMFPSAFVVNIEKGDSVHFNQVGGKKMRGFFKDDKINRMFVDGNAETIAFNRDSVKKIVTDMQRSLSSRIRINFKDGKLSDITFLSKPENRYGPLGKFTEDEKVLKGFIWKPKDRPVSKESIIPSLDKKRSVKKTTGKATQPAKAPPGIKAGRDTTGIKPRGQLKTGKDSTNASPAKAPALNIKKDSTNASPAKTPALNVKKDSTNNSPAKAPGSNAEKDTVATKASPVKPGGR